MKKLFLINYIVIALCLSTNINAQNRNNLHIQLKKQDSLFYEKGFNQCDFDYLDEHLADVLDFYHDEVGFVDRNGFFESMKSNICNNPKVKPIRKLIESSLETYPLYDNGVLYGAIQKGKHEFYLRESGKDDLFTSQAKFNTVWIKHDESWKVREIQSFNHNDTKTDPHKINKRNLEALLKKAKVPALGLGIIKKGKLKSIQIYGTLDGDRTAPLNTIFKVSSLTKPVFALTVLKLIENKQLGLDEKIYKYWIDPDVKNDKRYKLITPRLVLSHQTGFTNWRYLTEEKKLSFKHDPGTKYEYSGEGFEYLRKALEIKLGKPIEDLAQELVLDPLGMDDTRFWWNDSMDETRYAQNFNADGEMIPTYKYYKANGAADLLTTVEDYGKFLEYVVNGSGLSKELKTEMLRKQVKIEEDNHFGLGWQILSNFKNGEYALVHSGADTGVHTLAVIYPESKNGFLVFMNGDNILEIYQELLKNRLYLGNELWGKQ